jgi:hypothetical protein
MFSLPSYSNEIPLDITKETQRLGKKFKNLRVYYSAYASYSALDYYHANGDSFTGFNDSLNSCPPPLINLLKEANAQIVPLPQAKIDDVQIAYICYRTLLWVRVSRKDRVLFEHVYKSKPEEELEKMFIRDLESEDVIE